MPRYAALLTTIALTACSPFGGSDRPPPVVTAADTLCTVTTRYHASEGQKAAFRADRATWEPLVDWLAGFNAQRDRRCA